MTNKISMQDIIDLLASKNEIPKEEAEKFVVELFNVIEDGLTFDELVKVKDFGTFKLTDIQERESIDVNTQEKIIIPAHKRVSFVPTQTLKSIVNKPFAHFETTPLNDGIVLDNIKHDNASENNENEDAIEELGDIQENDPVRKAPFTVAKDGVSIVSADGFDNKDIPSIETKNKEVNEELPIAHADNSLNKIDEEIDEPEEAKSASIKPPINKIKGKKSKAKRPFLPWYIAMAVFIILGLLFAYNFYQKENSPANQGVEKSDIPKPIKEPSPVINDALPEEMVKPVVTLDTLETVSMEVGKTLRLIALDKYGSREFWVYIYLKNKEKIKNPDVVPVGLKLVLPDKTEYDISVENPESIAKAKRMGDEEMKKFW